MRKKTKLVVLSLLGFLIFNSCNSIKLSKLEYEYLVELTESKSFNFTFENNDLIVQIYESKIVASKDIIDFSHVISIPFFRTIVTKKNTISANGLVRLEYIDENRNEVYISITTFEEIIKIEKVFSAFDNIVNYPDSKNIELFNNSSDISSERINTVVNLSKIITFDLFKYKINNEKKMFELYWFINTGSEDVYRYKTVFNYNYKLINIERYNGNGTD